MNSDIPIIITPVSLDDVHTNNKVRYNTNNNWGEEGKPEDYDGVLDRYRTETWVHNFHEVTESRILTILEVDLRWMREAEKIGMITNEFSKIYEEDLDDFCNKIEQERPDFISELNKGGWFVRTNRVSLKNGVHGTGPYSSLRNIVESMVTGVSGHTGIGNAIGKIDLFLLPFLPNLDLSREFRVFVKERKITAISIQSLYCSNEWIEGMDELERRELVRRIVEFFETEIKVIYFLSYAII